MKQVFKLLFAATLLSNFLLAPGCKKDDGGDDPGTSVQILPGQGLNNLKIGDPAQKAFDAFGSVSDSYFEFGGKYYHFLLYLSKGIAVNLEPTNSATLDLNTKILDISLSTPYSGQTDKKIGIGSTKTAVEAAYGTPDSIDPLDGDKYNIGIAFDYGGGTTVETITVFK